MLLSRALLSLVLFASVPVYGQVPERINHQGRLLDGTNLVQGSVQLGLRLYDGEAGLLVYEETQTVAVVDGLYAVEIGASNAVPGSLFAASTNNELWLELVVDGTPLSPREPLLSVPYSWTSQGVTAGAITADMLASNAVTAGAIADGAVGSDAIGEGAIQSNNLAAGSVDASAIADGAVGTEEILDGSLVAGDLATTNDYALCRILYPDPWQHSGFGEALAVIHSNRFAVGAGFQDDGAGDAWIFDAEGDLVRNIPNPVADDPDARFGRAMAGNGVDRLLIGARDLDAGTNIVAGAVFLYDAEGILLQAVTNPLAGTTERFGYDIESLDANRFVVSMPRGLSNTGGFSIVRSSDGAVLMTVRDENTKFTSGFDRSFALLDSNTLIYGVPDARVDGVFNAGLVHLYALDTATKILTITNSPPRESNQFGWDVAVIHSNLFAVSTRFGFATFDGSVELFAADGSHVNTLVSPSGFIDNKAFGFSLVVDSDSNLLVGAPDDRPFGGTGSPGAAYLFRPDGTLLETFPRSAAQNRDQQAFGATVEALEDGTILVGDAAYLSGGGVFLFERKDYMPGVIAENVVSGEIDPSQLNLSELDRRYVNVAGDTVGGALTVDGPLRANDRFTIPGRLSTGFSNQGVVIGPLAFNDPTTLSVFHDTNGNHDAFAVSIGDGLFNEALIVKNDGAVGIGTDSPAGLLDVAGDVTVQSSLTVDGPASLGSGMSVTGDVDIAGALGATGDAVVGGAATVGNGMTVTGDVVVAGGVDASGDVTAAGHLLPGAQAFSYQMPGNTLDVRDEGETYIRSTGGYMLLGAGTVTLSVFDDVQLPQGAVITGADFYYYDNSGAGNFTDIDGRLRRRALGSAGNENIGVLTDSTPTGGASTSIKSVPLTSISGSRTTVDNDAFQYWVYANVTTSNPGDSNLRIFGFRVTYTLQSLLP